MGIREALNRYKKYTIGAASLFIIGAAAVVVFQLRGNGSVAASGAPARLYFSNDDGKTWFLDDATKIPPFAKDGKEAVRAHVYRTSDGTEFVGVLERYAAAGKKSIEAALSRPAEEQMLEDPYLAADGTREVKKPGAGTWVNANDPRAMDVQAVVSPKGKKDTVTLVPPPQ